MRAEAVASVTTTATRTREAVRCRSVRARLPGELLNTWPLSPAARRHLEACLTCQAQAARYRAILRALRSLRDDIEEAPARLLEQVLISLDVVERERSNPRVAIAASALAASVVAAAAVAVVRWVRSGAI